MILNSVVLIAALASGLGSAFFLSRMRPAIYDRRTLEEISGVPVWGGVSLVYTPNFIGERRQAIMIFILLSVLLVTLYGMAIFIGLNQWDVMTLSSRILGE